MNRQYVLEFERKLGRRFIYFILHRTRSGLLVIAPAVLEHERGGKMQPGYAP